MVNRPRELTRKERAETRKLATSMCANFDHEYGCLSLNCDCIMLNKYYTGSVCGYFLKSVLPVNAVLEKVLTGRDTETRPCSYCGTEFPVNGKHAYCSDGCKEKSRRRQKREHIRKKRDNL